jgi:hypothetical protein
MRCKYQYKEDNSPWIYCGYFKDKVICGCVEIEEGCDIYIQDPKEKI